MPRSLVTLVGLLIAALLLSRSRSWWFLDSVSASAALVHFPGLALADLAGLRAERASVPLLSEAAIETILASAEHTEANGDQDTVASVSLDDQGLHLVGLAVAQRESLDPGRAVVANGVLVGFAMRKGERAAFVPLTAPKLLLRVEIEAGSGDRVRAVLAGDRATNPRLRFPELRTPLSSGQFVRTVSGDAVLPGGGRVAVASGLQIGWLAEDAAKGSIRQFRVRPVREAIDGLSVMVLGVPTQRSFVERRRREFEIIGTLLRGPIGGLARRVEFLALVPTLGGRACHGTAASGPWFFGEIVQAGPGAARVAFEGPAQAGVAVLVAGASQPRHARVRLANATRFELITDGESVAVGDWLLTSGTQTNVPPGLLVGRVHTVDARGRAGVLERPLAPVGAAQLFLVRQS